MNPIATPPIPADPLLDRLERATRHAGARFAPGVRPSTGDRAARLELAALVTDIDVLVRDLRAARDMVRAQLDLLIAKTRAGDAYRRTAALRPIAGGSGPTTQGPFR